MVPTVCYRPAEQQPPSFQFNESAPYLRFLLQPSSGEERRIMNLAAIAARASRLWRQVRALEQDLVFSQLQQVQSCPYLVLCLNIDGCARLFCTAGLTSSPLL